MLVGSRTEQYLDAMLFEASLDKGSSSILPSSDRRSTQAGRIANNSSWIAHKLVTYRSSKTDRGSDTASATPRRSRRSSGEKSSSFFKKDLSRLLRVPQDIRRPSARK